MRRAIQELMEKNRELSERLSTLEAARTAPPKPEASAPPAARETGSPDAANAGARAKRAARPERPPADRPPVRATAEPPPARPAPEPESSAARPSGPASSGFQAAGPLTMPPSLREERLEQRVRDLESAKVAQESAVRSIIQDSFSKTGSKINEFVTLGGAIEVGAGRTSDFSGVKKDRVSLNTAELDLEIKVTDWMLGTLVLSYNDGTSILFPTTNGFNTGVDRVTVDKATVFIGDLQRFPLYAKVGRDVLAFGTSTGFHRSDVLSIENPLTVEIFETRANAVGFGFAFPTPKPGPAPSSTFVAPQVRPLAVSPLVNTLANRLGYTPPPYRRKTPTPFAAPVEPPPFYGSINIYDGNTVENINRRFQGNFNGRLGYQTRGHCGRSYAELTDSYLCPWALDVSVDYIGSVFDSRFLQDAYNLYLPRIGKTPGMAASVKLNFGPFLFVGEWNGAIKSAKFVDDANRRISIKPSAWSASLAYQFDWNPWLDTIGSRGSYIAASYSRSHGMAGVLSTGGGSLATPVRVGFAPESRMTLTAGEWVLENAKLVIEYSHVWDYAKSRVGTGRQADGVFVALTYTW